MLPKDTPNLTVQSNRPQRGVFYGCRMIHATGGVMAHAGSRLAVVCG